MTEFDEATVVAVADAICGALADWLPEPLHQMAYEDAARAALGARLKSEGGEDAKYFEERGQN